jgi:hypothetical protein
MRQRFHVHTPDYVLSEICEISSGPATGNSGSEGPQGVCCAVFPSGTRSAVFPSGTRRKDCNHGGNHLQPRPATQANYRNLLSRYDIADYLAVSVETASRSLTDLKHRGVIKLTGTRIVMIVNRNALEDGERTRLAA